MTRRAVLLAVIAVELAAGGWLVVRARNRPVPPAADLSALEPSSAEHIRNLSLKCRTADDWTALGTAHMAFGFYPEAAACHRAAVALDPSRAELHYLEGFALERLGLLDEANAAYRRAVELGSPSAADCWYFVGRNHLRREDRTAAADAFAAAGDHPSARYELARLAIRDGGTAEATAALDRLIAEFPRAVQPLTLRHRIESDAGRPADRFADRSERVRERLPTPFDREWKRLEAVFAAHGSTAAGAECRRLLVSGKAAEAEARLRAMQAANWLPEAADLLAEALLRQNRAADAVAVLDEAITRAGPSAWLLAALGDAHVAANNPDAAAAAWRRATHLGIGKDVAGVFGNLATYHQRANDPATATRFQARSLLAAGHEAFWLGEYARAGPLFQQATAADPELTAGWFHLGESLRLTGQPDPARTALRRCLSLDPHRGRAHTALALLDGGP